MATFKRLKLFTNVTQYDMNNLMIEEVWAYKFEKGTEQKTETTSLPPCLFISMR